jgi:eukaryotic-like serine/threonine-protein kinase
MGTYELCRPLGGGGFGEVHLARDVTSGVCRAIKTLRDPSNTDARRRFSREVRAMERLSHPHIMRVIEADLSGHVPYYVMPWMSGGSLATRAGQMPTGEVRRIARGLADALAHIHECGVIHRDVKPDNVLMDSKGRFVLADFGIANGDYITANATATALGTLGYVAPELAHGAACASGASDVYSLGATMFHLLTGERPPHLPTRPLDPGLHRQGVPSDLRALVRQMTDPDPRQRPSAALVATKLVRKAMTPYKAGGVEMPPRRIPSQGESSNGFSEMVSAVLGIGAVALVANALFSQR